MIRLHFHQHPTWLQKKILNLIYDVWYLFSKGKYLWRGVPWWLNQLWDKLYYKWSISY